MHVCDVMQVGQKYKHCKMTENAYELFNVLIYTEKKLPLETQGGNVFIIPERSE